MSRQRIKSVNFEMDPLQSTVLPYDELKRRVAATMKRRQGGGNSHGKGKLLTAKSDLSFALYEANSDNSISGTAYGELFEPIKNAKLRDCTIFHNNYDSDSDCDTMLGENGSQLSHSTIGSDPSIIEELGLITHRPDSLAGHSTLNNSIDVTELDFHSMFASSNVSITLPLDSFRSDQPSEESSRPSYSHRAWEDADTYLDDAYPTEESARSLENSIAETRSTKYTYTRHAANAQDDRRRLGTGAYTKHIDTETYVSSTQPTTTFVSTHSHHYKPRKKKDLKVRSYDSVPTRTDLAALETSDRDSKSNKAWRKTKSDCDYIEDPYAGQALTRYFQSIQAITTEYKSPLFPQNFDPVPDRLGREVSEQPQKPRVVEIKGTDPDSVNENAEITHTQDQGADMYAHLNKTNMPKQEASNAQTSSDSKTHKVLVVDAEVMTDAIGVDHTLMVKHQQAQTDRDGDPEECTAQPEWEIAEDKKKPLVKYEDPFDEIFNSVTKAKEHPKQEECLIDVSTTAEEGANESNLMQFSKEGSPKDDVGVSTETTGCVENLLTPNIPVSNIDALAGLSFNSISTERFVHNDSEKITKGENITHNVSPTKVQNKTSDTDKDSDSTQELNRPAKTTNADLALKHEDHNKLKLNNHNASPPSDNQGNTEKINHEGKSNNKPEQSENIRVMATTKEFADKLPPVYHENANQPSCSTDTSNNHTDFMQHLEDGKGDIDTVEDGGKSEELGDGEKSGSGLNEKVIKLEGSCSICGNTLDKRWCHNCGYDNNSQHRVPKTGKHKNDFKPGDGNGTEQEFRVPISEEITITCRICNHIIYFIPSNVDAAETTRITCPNCGFIAESKNNNITINSGSNMQSNEYMSQGEAGECREDKHVMDCPVCKHSFMLQNGKSLTKYSITPCPNCCYVIPNKIIVKFLSQEKDATRDDRGSSSRLINTYETYLTTEDQTPTPSDESNVIQEHKRFGHGGSSSMSVDSLNISNNSPRQGNAGSIHYEKNNRFSFTTPTKTKTNPLTIRNAFKDGEIIANRFQDHEPDGNRSRNISSDNNSQCSSALGSSYNSYNFK